MTFFKKFTDFCGGFSVFAALMFLLREWMSFAERDGLPFREGLRLFFGPEAQKDRLAPLVFVVLMVFALTLSRIFVKHPWVGLLCSILPMVQVLFFFHNRELYEHPMLYLILVSLFVFGHLADAIVLDRNDGRRRAYFATQLLALLIFIFGIIIYVRGLQLLARGTEEGLRPLALAVYRGALDGTHTLWLVTGLFAGIGTLWSLGLRDLYFLDLFPVLPPFFLILWAYFGEKEILFFTTLFFLVALAFVARLLLMLFEPPKDRCHKDTKSS